MYKPGISTSVALTYTKRSTFIPVYILKVFIDKFAHVSFLP